MTHPLAVCLVLASLTFAVPKPAAAANINTLFDTVDTVEINSDSTNGTAGTNVVVTGIRHNTTVPVTMVFNFLANTDMAARCERFAVIAMSKPGKFQLAIGTSFSGGPFGGCRLILVTP